MNLDFDVKYEGLIFDGQPVVQGTNPKLELIDGRELAGLTMKKNIFNLGVSEDCFGQGKNSDGNWCPDGFTINFWLKIDKRDQPIPKPIRIFGNSDLDTNFQGFGIFLEVKDDETYLKFYIFKRNYYLIYVMGKPLLNQWFEILITFDHVLGGFAVNYFN